MAQTEGLVSGPIIRSLFHFASFTLALKPLPRQPGDGRLRRKIPAASLGWRPAARLPYALAGHRGGRGPVFQSPPIDTFQRGEDRIEVWDAGDFDPWETLDWRTVRLMRYRQREKDGSVVQWAGRREHQLTAPCGG